jgi:hypothetical protein
MFLTPEVAMPSAGDEPLAVKMELGGFETGDLSVSRGAVERASPEGIVSTHTDPQTEVRSPAEEARMGGAGLEPATSCL